MKSKLWKRLCETEKILKFFIDNCKIMENSWEAEKKLVLKNFFYL